jgi:hypothetical protein
LRPSRALATRRDARTDRPDLTLTVAVPEIMARHWWHWIMHDRIARRLRRTLQALPGVVVTSVPFHLAHG